MNKRGITAAFLVGIIIVVAGFLIILAFFPTISKVFTGTSDKEMCHDSVLLKAAAIEKGKLLGQYIVANQIPLKCKTEEIKITDTDSEKIKNQIANAMYECWWMLGEGNKQFFGQTLTSNTYCVICSTIEFDINVQEKTPEITGLGQWFSDNYVPGKNITYWQYFTNNPAAVFVPTSGLVNEKYPTNQKYAVVFSLWSKQYLTKAITGATMCAGAGIAGAKLGALAGGAIGTVVPILGNAVGAGTGLVIGGVGGCVIGLFTGGALQDAWDNLIGYGANYYISMQGIPYDAQKLRDMGCTSLQSIP